MKFYSVMRDLTSPSSEPSDAPREGHVENGKPEILRACGSAPHPERTVMLTGA